jgi:hypothetical protein
MYKRYIIGIWIKILVDYIDAFIYLLLAVRVVLSAIISITEERENAACYRVMGV